MPPSDRSPEIGLRFPARFDPDAFAEDLARTTPPAVQPLRVLEKSTSTMASHDRNYDRVTTKDATEQACRDASRSTFPNLPAASAWCSKSYAPGASWSSNISRSAYVISHAARMH